MPLDSNFGDNLFNSRCLGWERSFAWLPRRCHLSKRWIWLQSAWVGSAMFIVGDHFVFEHRWHHPVSHTWWLLKQ